MDESDAELRADEREVVRAEDHLSKFVQTSPQLRDGAGKEAALLEHYFIRPETVDRIRGSWLGGAIERYVSWRVCWRRGVVVDATPSRVTWFALADFMYTSELAPSREVGIVRRSLSSTGAPKVVFSHRLAEPQNRHKVGAIAIGPNEIYTLVDTKTGTRFQRQLVGLCKE